jgi:hypothetical protein
MPEPAESTIPTLRELQARLQEVTQLLRQPTTIDEQARQALAELTAELARLLDAGAVPAEEVKRLAENTTHLAEALHHPHPSSGIAGIRERFEQALASAEAHAPLAVGLARRLVNALANLGI